MCGARQPAGAQRCSECGEWISKKTLESLGRIEIEKVKKFRREIHGLAGFWIFFGGLSVAIAIFLLGSEADFLGQMGPEERAIVAGITLLLGGIWIASGIASAYKQRWGVITGLIVTYLNLGGNLIQLNPCGIIISIFVIIQAHRVLKISKELIQADIPLTYKPR